jgi:hypothetical protein
MGPGEGGGRSSTPSRTPRDLLNKRTDWRAIDDAEDWDSLMRWLNGASRGDCCV